MQVAFRNRTWCDQLVNRGYLSVAGVADTAVAAMLSYGVVYTFMLACGGSNSRCAQRLAVDCRLHTHTRPLWLALLLYCQPPTWIGHAATETAGVSVAA